MTCCPPRYSRFKTSYEFRRNRLLEEISFAKKILFFFGCFFLFLFMTLIYAFVNIVKIIRRYFQQKNMRQELDDKFKNSIRTNNNFHLMREWDNFHDNYTSVKDPSKFAEMKNDYDLYQTSINTSINQYRSYNEKLRKFFNKIDKNDDMKLQSLVDHKILDKNYDDW